MLLRLIALHTNGRARLLRDRFSLTLYDLYRTHHESYGLKAGLTAAQLKVIRDTSTALSDKVDPESLLSELQRASLAYADWMTRKVQVPQHVFDALKSSLLNDQQIVEATATVAGYNMVSRYLVALDVGELAQVPVPEALTL